MAAKAGALVLSLAALCLPAFANIPRDSFVAEKPRQGVEGVAAGSHRGQAIANALTAPGIPRCLCDEGRRSRSTGKERDAETGLDYFGARYMSAAMGRFTSPDPENAGADLIHPQSWNAYSYTLNNPLRFTDPDGEAPIDVVTGFFNGFHASYTLGRSQGTGNSDYRLGQRAGAKVAQGLGLIEMSLGGLSVGGGGAACVSTGIACALVPAITAGGTALTAHGAVVAGTAQVVFSQANDDSSGGGDDSTPHGKQRKEEARQGDSNRQGDRDRTRKEGRAYRDTETGMTIYVRDGHVVVDTANGKYHTNWNNQKASNTADRVQRGKWEPIQNPNSPKPPELH